MVLKGWVLFRNLFIKQELLESLPCNTIFSICFPCHAYYTNEKTNIISSRSFKCLHPAGLRFWHCADETAVTAEHLQCSLYFKSPKGLLFSGIHQ